MNLFNDLPEGVCRRDVPLAPLTWFHLGGRADYFIEPETAEQAALVVHRCRETGTLLHVLGMGANVLVPDDGVRGVVMRLMSPGLSGFRIEGERLVAGGGADLMKIIKRTVREGLSGVEQLAGIPATVGGGIAMNCGGRFGDIGAVTRSVRVIDGNGRLAERTAESLRFAYRTCMLNEDVVVEAEFALVREDPQRVQRRFHEVWEYKQSSQPTLAAHSAGCIFRNPDGHSAGRLIDEAGLKGFRVGSAHVSERHANFAVVDDGGRAADVRRLIDEIILRVEQASSIRLEPEVKLW